MSFFLSKFQYLQHLLLMIRVVVYNSTSALFINTKYSSFVKITDSMSSEEVKQYVDMHATSYSEKLENRETFFHLCI